MTEDVQNDEKYSNFVRKQTEMNKKAKGIDESKLVYNPFCETLEIKISQIEDRSKTLVTDDGEKVPAYYYVEKDKATRIYLSAANRNTVMGLSTGAMRMYMFILHDITPANDWITVLPEWYKENGGKSLNVYKQAIEELVAAKYITPTIYKWTYWVNPRFFYPGNRINKYPDNLKVMNNTTSGKAGVKMNNSK
jgi:hypothetical protein